MSLFEPIINQNGETRRIQGQSFLRTVAARKKPAPLLSSGDGAILRLFLCTRGQTGVRQNTQEPGQANGKSQETPAHCWDAGYSLIKVWARNQSGYQHPPSTPFRAARRCHLRFRIEERCRSRQYKYAQPFPVWQWTRCRRIQHGVLGRSNAKQSLNPLLLLLLLHFLEVKFQFCALKNVTISLANLARPGRDAGKQSEQQGK